MDKLASIVKILDRKANGNPDILGVIYNSAMAMIRGSCKSDDEFKEKCEVFLDMACKAAGEEHREFYREYMMKMASGHRCEY